MIDINAEIYEIIRDYDSIKDYLSPILTSVIVMKEMRWFYNIIICNWKTWVHYVFLKATLVFMISIKINR